MQKIQVLFPDPLMQRLRQYAKQEDLPVSEVIRRASETWLARYPESAPHQSPKVPVQHLGKMLIDADVMRDAFYE
jgi:metal-responsive CopG/Arc/MetJ family transcriptional regulator